MGRPKIGLSLLRDVITKDVRGRVLGLIGGRPLKTS